MGPENRRLLLAVALSIAVFAVWGKLAPKGSPTRQGAAPSAPGGGAVPRGPDRAAGSGEGVPEPKRSGERPAEQTVTLESDQAVATFSTYGGALKSWALKGEKFQAGGGARRQVDLVVTPASGPYPLSVSQAGDAAALTGEALREPMELKGHDGRSVTFEGRVGSSVIRKTVSLGSKPFELKVDLSASTDAEVVIWMPADVTPPEKRGFLAPPAAPAPVPTCRAGEKTARFDGKSKAERLEGQAEWSAIDESYFLAAVMADRPAGTCVFAKVDAERSVSAAGLALGLKAGTPEGLTFYAGPKRLDLIRAYGRNLESSINYGPVAGLFSFFARILLWLMRLFESLVHNWGAAIILLTVLVKVALYPLTRKQLQSMQEMRRLQPEIDKLKARFGEDREKLNLAMMQLYQQHKVNPLGGCLPMLVQMPIWFALYATLQTSVELYREPFLWVKDLTTPDPLFVLPVLMGASSFLMQKLSPQPADNAQAKMLLYVMPIFLTIVMWKLPAGLTLYIVVNNLLSIAQQKMWTPRAERELVRA